MRCNYCQGDEALHWKDEGNNAFIDGQGEILATVNKSDIVFNVACCPMCGRRFKADEDYGALEVGDIIYHVNQYTNKIMIGKVESIYSVETYGMIVGVRFWENNDYIEFYEKSLGTSLFMFEQNAMLKIK